MAQVKSVTSTSQELIAVLQQMHPDIRWGEWPLGDYDQYAEADAPDILVTFNSAEEELEGLADPYTTIYGKYCKPSQWGLSEVAAQLIQAHNKVFVAKYPNCDGPKLRFAAQSPSSPKL